MTIPSEIYEKIRQYEILRDLSQRYERECIRYFKENDESLPQSARATLDHVIFDVFTADKMDEKTRSSLGAIKKRVFPVEGKDKYAGYWYVTDEEEEEVPAARDGEKREVSPTGGTSTELPQIAATTEEEED